MSKASKTARSLTWAGIAAFVGCAACCALPMIAMTTLGSGAAATIASFVGPGTELFVGASVFVVVMGFLMVRGRAKASAGCGPACRADGGCCEVGREAKGMR